MVRRRRRREKEIYSHTSRFPYAWEVYKKTRKTKETKIGKRDFREE